MPSSDQSAAPSCNSAVADEGGRSSRRPHVVLLPLPNAQGHMNPMMQLAKRLASSGILVTFITIEYSIARLLRSQKAHQLDQSVRLIGVPDGLSADADRHVVSREYIGMLERVGVEIELLLRKLMEDEDVPPITCLIGDVFLESVRAIANKLHLPRCSFWPQSATILTIHSLLDTITSNGYDPLEREVPPFAPKDISTDAMVTCVPGLSKLHQVYFPYYTGLGDIGLSTTLRWVKNTISNLDECVCIVGNTFKELEPKPCEYLGPKFYAMGPLVPTSFLKSSDNEQEQEGSGASFWEEEYDNCMEWLDKQPNSSVVYVSFGSLTRLSKDQTQEIAKGLMASNQRFLWVIRKDSILEQILDISKALPENFIELTKNQGKVVYWAPQLAVLSHIAVGGFFSHCGWNSVLESMMMGVPMLAWPQIVDQVTNCWMLVHEWKFGFELIRDYNNKPNPKEVENAIRNLMEGEDAQEMRVRATNLRDISRNAISKSHGSSTKNLNMFVDDLYKMAANKQCLKKDCI